MHYEHKESTRASAGREASRAGTVALIDLRVPHRHSDSDSDSHCLSVLAGWLSCGPGHLLSPPLVMAPSLLPRARPCNRQNISFSCLQSSYRLQLGTPRLIDCGRLRNSPHAKSPRIVHPRGAPRSRRTHVPHPRPPPRAAPTPCPLLACRCRRAACADPL